MQKKFKYILLSLFSAILFSAGWLFHQSIFILFAFVPLLQLEDHLSQRTDLARRKLKLFAYSYLSFLTWNLLTTWWVSYASVGGACMAYILNSLFMSITFMIFSNLKKRINKPYAIWLLIPLWIGYEYLHTVWDLSWTWLILGNVFAFNTNFIQWFEFTGTSGGTLWVLFTNILIFFVLKNNTSLKIISTPVLKIAAAIIIPILFSYLILIVRQPLSASKDKINVVVVQPNIDPYNAKFVMDFQLQFQRFLDLVRGKINNETDYVVLPETFIIGEGLDEDELAQNPAIIRFSDSLIKKFPKLKIIVGADSYKIFKHKSEITPTAREDDGIFYDSYNTALQLDAEGIQIYHKSKLVPGAEIMPLAFLLKPLESLALDMGGTMGTLGTQKERTVFTDKITGASIAPVICYESIYSNYVTEYVRKNANIIFIITNDGWWDNTPGHVQHLYYARLRAIENRLQIARSANTGISCFIDEFGNVSDATKYWEDAVISKTLYLNNNPTFFSKFGDLIAYFSAFSSVLLVLFSMYLRFKNRTS